MAVGKQHQGLDEFGQRPAVFTRLQQGLEGRGGKGRLTQCLIPGALHTCGAPASLPPHLDVFLGDEPWPMCQQLVDLAQFTQLLWRPMEAQQPLWVTTSLQELGHVGAHEV